MSEPDEATDPNDWRPMLRQRAAQLSAMADQQLHQPSVWEEECRQLGIVASQLLRLTDLELSSDVLDMSGPPARDAVDYAADVINVIGQSPAAAVEETLTALSIGATDLLQSAEQIIVYILRHPSKLSGNTASTVRHVREVLDQLANSRKVERLVARATASAEEAEGTVAHIKQLAGEGATVNLAEHFRDYARSEHLAGRWMQGATAFILVGVSVAAYLVVSGKQKAGSSAWSTEWVKVTVTIPVLALAYYLAREASGHMNAFRSAKEIEVRLSSVLAYTDELPDADRLAIRAQFGRAIFVIPDWKPASGAAKNSLGQETIDLASKAVDVAKAVADKSK